MIIADADDFLTAAELSRLRERVRELEAEKLQGAGMDQQETFNWLVERHRELLAIEAIVEERFGIEQPTDDDPRWFLRAEPGPIECYSLAEALTECAEMWEREDEASRSQLSLAMKVVEAARAFVSRTRRSESARVNPYEFWSLNDAIVEFDATYPSEPVVSQETE